jgi:receptor protein-tyrosine kinase
VEAETGEEVQDRLSLRSRGELDHVIRILRGQRNLILLCTLVAGVVALAYSLHQQRIYSATAELLFRDADLDQEFFGTTVLPPSTDPTREAATNLSLVSLQAVAQQTATALGGGATAASIASEVSASPAGESDIVAVTANDPNPVTAARIANTYAQQFIAFRRDADRAKVAGAQQLVQTQLSQLQKEGQGSSPNAATLEHDAAELGILASLQTGNAELVQPAIRPSSPSSPKTMRNAVLGFVIGLLFGIAVALLLDRLDRRINDVEELEDIYRLPVLCDIPESPALSTDPARGAQGFAVAESFRMLRARLRYFNIDREIRSLLVTSVGPSEGKTTVAENLAAAAAGSGATRTLLVEADLRRPRLAGNLGLASGPGLAEALTHGVGLDEVVQRLVFAPGEDGIPDKTLDVIVAGINPPNPAELLESDAMADLLDRLSAIYDLVVIDTPPAGLIADVIPLMRRVGGIVIVASIGRSTSDAAAHFRDQLAQLNAPVLGVIANRVKRGRGDRYYDSYGAYYGGDSPVSEPSVPGSHKPTSTP